MRALLLVAILAVGCGAKHIPAEAQLSGTVVGKCWSQSVGHFVSIKPDKGEERVTLPVVKAHWDNIRTGYRIRWGSDDTLVGYFEWEGK